MIDNDPESYPAPVIRSWKRLAETEAFLAIGRRLEPPAQHELSAQELDILFEAADQGDVWVLGPYDGGFKCVRSGRKDFSDPADPAVAAVYVDAVDALVTKDLLHPQGKSWYKLSGEGFRIARAVKAYLQESGV